MDRDRSIDHREYEELLAPAALGALSAEEHALLAPHLRSCASCREALARLMSAADVLPSAVAERAPSAALRERLLAQVGADPRAARPEANAPAAWDARAPGADEPVPLRVEPVEDEPVSLADHRRRRGVLSALAIAATLLVGLLAGVLLDRLVLDDGDAPDVRELALESPTGMALEDARLEYLVEPGIVRFAGERLPDLPEGQVYQAWLLADEDGSPTPVGLIDPTGEFVAKADPRRYSTFAVTVESGPLGSTAPTSDPVIVAQLPDPAEL